MLNEQHLLDRFFVKLMPTHVWLEEVSKALCVFFTLANGVTVKSPAGC